MLPQSSPEEQQLSEKLTGVIRQAIEQGSGGVDFSCFMKLALYEPQYGYYMVASEKFGAAGDFITAPQASPVFARCLARQILQGLQASGGDTIMEIGAGNGLLAAELLLALERLGEVPRRYLIVDISAVLRDRQRACISRLASHLIDRVRWESSVPARPFRGVVIANEVLDALPVERFHYDGDAIKQVRVGWDGQGLRLQYDHHFTPERQARLEKVLAAYLPRFPVGYTSEFNFDLPDRIARWSSMLERGVMLCIDYGYPRREYYHPQRVDGTLVCHYRHRAHGDPLVLVGLQDISAFVDFTAVAEAGASLGLEVAGYATQAHFLIGCGLQQVLQEFQTGGMANDLRAAREVKRLTMPGEMGEQFKVVALSKEVDEPLIGFSCFNHRARL